MYATCYCVYAIYKVILVLYKQSGGYKKMHKFDYKKRTTYLIFLALSIKTMKYICTYNSVKNALNDMFKPRYLNTKKTQRPI